MELASTPPLKVFAKPKKKKSVMRIKKQSPKEQLESAPTPSPGSNMIESPLPSDCSHKSPEAKLKLQHNSQSDNSFIRAAIPGKMSSMPYAGIRAGSDTNKSLPIIKEDEREHEKIDITDQDEFERSSSTVSDNLGDKSAISSLKMLPYF